jgi:hypothetical protein
LKPKDRSIVDFEAIVVLGLALGACASPRDLDLWPVLEPRYPEQPALDYAPLSAQAHAALPLADPTTGELAGPGRIWIKGSPSVRSAELRGGAVALDPPYYAALVEAPAGRVVVDFAGEGAPISVEVHVPDAAAWNEARERFSLLAYGCFDPFAVEKGRAIVDPGSDSEDGYARLHAIRELFRDAARGDVAGFPEPDLVCGAGDQVYVEPAHDSYAAFGAAHPLSAWTVERMPRPRLDLGSFVRFLDETYRKTWSFTTLDEVLRSKPAVMIWDDHEIRDGWGSQGDEHVFVDTYYAAARDAFVQHQFRRGPRPWDAALAAPRASLHQSLALHGLPIFVFDQRSARDVRVPQVLGDAQWTAFTAWLDALDPARMPYYVLVSPLPLLYRVSNLAQLAADLDPEVRDDMLDAWSSAPNTPELDRILERMVVSWRRGLRAIVISGDMHLSAILSATVRDGERAAPAVFAYEIVASGLAGRFGGDWKFLVGREGALLDAPTRLGSAAVSMAMGLSESCPNFAGLEIDGAQAIAHVFQALPDGTVHYRVPLQWDREADDLGAMVSEGRHAPERRPAR